MKHARNEKILKRTLAYRTEQIQNVFFNNHYGSIVAHDDLVDMFDDNSCIVISATRKIFIRFEKSALSSCFSHHWKRVRIMLQSGR